MPALPFQDQLPRRRKQNWMSKFVILIHKIENKKEHKSKKQKQKVKRKYGIVSNQHHPI